MERFPEQEEAQKELLEQVQALKQKLIDFTFGQHEDFLFQEARKRAGSNASVEHKLADLVETLLFDQNPYEERPLLEVYLEEAEGLSAEERLLLESWSQSQSGLYWVLRRDGQKILTLDLLNDQQYTLTTTERDPRVLRQMKRGTCFLSRVVPLYDVWLLSGTQQFANFPNQTVAYGFAHNIAQQLPMAFFSNPEHLRLSKQLEQAQAEMFQSLFGESWVVGTPKELEAAYSTLVSEILKGVQGNEDAPPVKAKLGLGKQFSSSNDDLGLVVHSEVGIKVVPDWKTLVEFGEENIPLNDEILRLFNETASHVPPPMLEKLAERYPEPMNELLQVILDEPSAQWVTHGEDWLRQVQPDWFSVTRIPSLMAFPEHYMEGKKALEAWKAAGRPKKFKWKRKKR